MATHDSFKKRIFEATGEAVVKATQRTIHILDVIVRQDGLPPIYVAKYENSYGNNHYFFYRDELSLPEGQRQSNTSRTEKVS